MAFPSIQPSFVSGELAPSLFGRVDLAKYHSGASTMRNFFVNYTGGASTRAGLLYCGTCKQPASAAPARNIPFQYNINQGFVLEFGDQYMRIVFQAAYVTEAAKTITGITQANPGVVTSNSHGLSNGDWVFISGISGMIELNGLIWVVANVTTNSFTLVDMFGVAVNTASFAAYVSGGTAARIYTVASPYAAADLPYLKFVQSANVMTLDCVNTATGTEYPPYDLQRITNTNWTFTQTTYASAIAAPASCTVTAEASTTLSTYYSYLVTAVDNNGQESVPSPAGVAHNNDIAVNAGSNLVTWAAVTGAVSYNIYAAVPSYNVATPIGVAFGYIGSAFGTQFIDTNITPDFARTPPIHQNPFARGQITNVAPTAGGTNYTQGGIGYTITTATGSGFLGTPIVVNGALAGFYIQNNGKNYAPGDTMAITGGTANATGTYTFTGNPANNQTIILGGTTWTFKTSGAIGAQTNIEQTVASTLAALVVDLNASADVNISLATYSLNGLVLTITYKVGGAGGNAYTLAAGTYGGTVSGANLTGGATGGGATVSLTIGAQTGTYPSVPFYFEQRRGYANAINSPDTYFFSKPGQYTNMDAGIPPAADDAIVGTPWAQQVNGIQWALPMPNGLVVLTGNGGWLLTGVNGAALAPASQFVVQQAAVGCSPLVPPILINNDILYVQSKNSIVRDLTYNFFSNIYTGDDKTILANHLFANHSIIQWAYSEEPFKIIWAVRDDGILLSFTWLKEQDIWAWARHDTNGQVVSICSVTQKRLADIRSGAATGQITNAVYVIVKRYVNGQWLYYQEMMDDRLWQDVEQSFCVDAGLSYPMNYPNATLTPSAVDGANNISGTLVANGGINYTNPVAVAIDETGVGTGVTFNVTVVGGVITAVTPGAQGQLYTRGATQIRITDPTGSGAVVYPVITNIISFSASASVFTSQNIGDVIRIGGGKATVTTYVSGTQVLANVTQEITSIIPDDTGEMPVPAIAGAWSITTPVSVVSGLNHLNGKTVAILADGSVSPNQVVANNSITLQTPASAISIGLPYTCQLQSMYLDPPGQPVTVQGRRKLIPAVTVRVKDTRGISVGVNQPDASVQPNGQNVPWADMLEIKQRGPGNSPGTAIPLATGDLYKKLKGSWEKPAQVAIQTNFPLPATILAIIPQAIIGDDGG